MGIQNTSIVGVVDSTPDLRYVNDTQVMSFSVCVMENYRDRASGELKTSKAWYKVEAWGQLALDISALVDYGSVVHVSGKVRADPYMKKDGSPGASLKLRANSITVDGADPTEASQLTEIPF
jgi:single-strand DNA-binding protein